MLGMVAIFAEVAAKRVWVLGSNKQSATWLISHRAERHLLRTCFFSLDPVETDR